MVHLRSAVALPFSGSANMNALSRLIAALLVGAGIAVAGYSVSQGLERFRMSDRSVTVKGLAEKDIESDFAVWTLAFRRAGNEFAGVQQALAGDRDGALSDVAAADAMREALGQGRDSRWFANGCAYAVRAHLVAGDLHLHMDRFRVREAAGLLAADGRADGGDERVRCQPEGGGEPGLGQYPPDEPPVPRRHALCRKRSDGET